MSGFAIYAVTNTLIGLRLVMVILSLWALWSWSRCPRARTASDRFMSFTWLLTTLGLLMFQPQNIARLLMQVEATHMLLMARAQDIVATSIFAAVVISIIAGQNLRRGFGVQRVKATIAGQIFLILTVESGVWAAR